MNLLNVKDFDVKETIGSVISKLSWVVKLAMVFKPTPEVKLASVALTLLETIKDKKVSDLTIEEIINIKSAYDAAKPIKEPEKPVKPEVKPELEKPKDAINPVYILNNDHCQLLGHISGFAPNPFDVIMNAPVNFDCSYGRDGMRAVLPFINGGRNMLCITFDASGNLLQVADQDNTYNSNIAESYDNAAYYMCVNIDDLSLKSRTLIKKK